MPGFPSQGARFLRIERVSGGSLGGPRVETEGADLWKAFALIVGRFNKPRGRTSINNEFRKPFGDLSSNCFRNSLLFEVRPRACPTANATNFHRVARPSAVSAAGRLLCVPYFLSRPYREDKNDKSGTVCLPDFRPLGAHGGPREPWDGLRLGKCRLHQKSAPETNSKARSLVLCVVGAGRKKIKR